MNKALIKSLRGLPLTLAISGGPLFEITGVSKKHQ